jgi:hypothetical protein
MQIIQDRRGEPVRSDLRLLLLLAALCPIGVLMWAGLVLSVFWSLSAAWAIAGG